MKATASRKYSRLTESNKFHLGAESIDRGNCLIRNVKVLGLESRNGRRYAADAVKRAIPLYEAVMVCIDHCYEDKKGRKTGERWGRLVNVRQDDRGDLFADLQYLNEHPMTELILEQIERFGDGGLSHDADGHMERSNGSVIVTDIRKVFSVDFVLNPATNENLFESEGNAVKRKLYDVLREQIDNKIAARLLARLTEARKCENTEVEMQEGDDPLNMALRTSIMEILDGEGTIEEKLDGIRQLCGGGTSEPPSDETGMEEAEALKAENSRLKEEILGLKKSLDDAKASTERSDCQKLLESSGREITDARVEALLALPAEKRGALVEEFPKAKSRPSQSPPKYQAKDSGASNFNLKEATEEARRRLGLPV